MVGTTRRRFLRHAAVGGGAIALGDLPLIPGLRAVSAAEASVDATVVQFQPEIEPLVRFLEETPRERLIEELAARVANGLSYREVLTALLLAGVRNVQPRPAVGFKFHAVLVVNSAHLASLASPAADRWLPMFWAVDTFKGSQARDVSEGNWTMAPVRDADVPDVGRAEQAFLSAMEQWDEAAADTAIAGLARTQGAHRLFELFARLGARDFRSIGHKAIYVANSFRTLHCIGWRYAEPVLRSLAYALLNHEGEANPAQADLAADRPWRANLPRAAQIRAGWQQGRVDRAATQDLLSSLRTATADEVSQQVVELLNAQVAPQSIFDGLFVAAGEMLMRQPGIVALHATTTTNAMRYAFDTVADNETRKLLLLQNAAFLTLFRDAMQNRGAVGSDQIDQLQPAEFTSPQDPVAEVFQAVGEDRALAARKLLGYLDSGLPPENVIRAARQLIFLKGDDSHDYKFSSAIMEDYHHISPDWRNRFLAASTYQLRGSHEATNGLVERIRQAIG